MTSESAGRLTSIERRTGLAAGWRLVDAVFSVPGSLIILGAASAWLYFWGGDLHRFTQWIAAYVSLFVAQFAIYAAACYAVLRPRVRLTRGASLVSVVVVLVFAAGFRAQLADERPYLSTDVYRYIWDGRVQAAGINPYRYTPAAEELSELRDQNIYPKINRGDYAITPYPPVAQAVFYAIYFVKPSSVTAFKLGMSLFDLLTAVLLVLMLMKSGLEPARVVLFAWNPLLIFESAHSGHIESVFIAFLALAFWAWTSGRFAATGVGLGLATMVKFYPALLLPVLLVLKPGVSLDTEATVSSLSNRSPKTLFGIVRGLFSAPNIKIIAAFVITIALSYVPYLSVGAGVFGPMASEFREEGYIEEGDRYFLLALLRSLMPVPTSLFLIFAAVVLAGLGVWSLLLKKRSATDLARAALALIGTYLLILSPRYPWYYAWLIPYLCFVPKLAWFYLSGATVLLYLSWYTPLRYPDLPLWLGVGLYLPTIAMLIWERWRGEEPAQ